MQNKIIVYAAICISYYHLGGLATTNILRLTKGNTLSVASSECKCFSCGNPIKAFFQLPIISYILCRGKCRNCGVSIPLSGLILEMTVWLGMSLISLLTGCSLAGILLSFLFYESVRAVCVLIFGRRNDSFFVQYLLSMLLMVPYFLIIELMGLIGLAV